MSFLSPILTSQIRGAAASQPLRGAACAACSAVASSSSAGRAAAAAQAAATFSTSSRRPEPGVAPPSAIATQRPRPNRGGPTPNGARSLEAILQQVGTAVEPTSQVGQIRAREQDKAAGTYVQAKLFQSKSLRPGDLNYKRMYPALGPTPQKSVLNTTSLGPGRKRARQTDYFLAHNDINPLDEPLNVRLHSRFVTNMGKIMNRAQTQLTSKNQRRMGKAVRRARSMGIVPYFADWSDDFIRSAKEKRFGLWRTGRSS